MSEQQIVHFVCFETILDLEQFSIQWNRFNRSANSDLDVCLQQSQQDGHYNYIAQHRCAAGELQFDFSKAKRPSRAPEVGIKTIQSGGYIVIQDEKVPGGSKNESKVFVFLTDPLTDIDKFRQLPEYRKLVIYEAYYENCQHAFILEYFVQNKSLPVFLQQLKEHYTAETGVYKICDIS